MTDCTPRQGQRPHTPHHSLPPGRHIHNNLSSKWHSPQTAPVAPKRRMSSKHLQSSRVNKGQKVLRPAAPPVKRELTQKSRQIPNVQ